MKDQVVKPYSSSDTFVTWKGSHFILSEKFKILTLTLTLTLIE